MAIQHQYKILYHIVLSIYFDGMSTVSHFFFFIIINLHVNHNLPMYNIIYTHIPNALFVLPAKMLLLVTCKHLS